MDGTIPGYNGLVIQLLALILGAAASYLPHLLFGEHLSFFAEFCLGTLTGGAAYVASVYFLKKARGDF